MNSLTRDFVSEDPRSFKFKFGRYLASSLAGFAAGIVAASLVWIFAGWYTAQLQSAAELQSKSSTQSQSIPSVHVKK